ncbi:MAG TPA: hypothetical protein VHD60_03155 [Candidatus Saccharimonadales bacterium]|nr:hypothetical protein [Candidatus Saccharimonadales bacterium]
MHRRLKPPLPSFALKQKKQKFKAWLCFLDVSPGQSSNRAKSLPAFYTFSKKKLAADMLCPEDVVGFTDLTRETKEGRTSDMGKIDGLCACFT